MKQDPTMAVGHFPDLKKEAVEAIEEICTVAVYNFMVHFFLKKV